ncbi:prepilin peptidase [Effusibacillus lacus]|uniref:Prepilin leader peptidase/N-methyltransferase n=1 Tax=Effusibacillus lacus TaxID=1348429 RepID=A0A292YI41_9BACL|nr:prepilin peptidase [Effusibacillus lacus]
MNWLLILYAVLFGLLVGSFLNVVSIRFPKGESIVVPPSRCPHCGTRLGILDLVPVFSWLFLRGRCRACKGTIHWQYPVVEAITALLWGVVAWRFGWSWETVLGLAFVSFLIPLAVIDIKELLLPNVLTYPLLAVAIIGRFAIGSESLWTYFLGGVLGAGFLLFLWWISPYLFGKEGMGLGDVKLMAGIGVMTGLSGAILTMFLASLSGLAVGLYLQKSGRLQTGQHMPFGPFLCGGAMIAYLFGESIVAWYLNFLK